MIILLSMLALVTGISFVQADPLPLIKKVTVQGNRVDIQIHDEFKKKYLKSDFFVEYDEDINLEQFDYSIVTLPFIMNVISLVWISGQEWYVDEIDGEVLESLKRIKQVFQIMYPKTPWTGRLVTQKLAHHPPVQPTSDRIALLFSGGVDSTASSFYHKDTPQLLVTAWGQSALPLHQPKLWNQVKNRMKSFAQKYGHQNAFLKSNYYYFLNLKKLKTLSPEIVTWRCDTIEDIGWAGLIAPILLSRGIPTLKIGASEHWSVPIGSAASPYIDRNIRFAGIKIYHDLFSMTRHDKIAYIVDLCRKKLVEKPQFIICQKPGNIINCGHCEKCCLTLALLLGVDAHPREYGFNLSKEDAAYEVEDYLEYHDSFMVTSLWEYKELKKRVAAKRNIHLWWLKDIDLSKKRAFTLKKDSHMIDWKELNALFPHVRSETT